MYLKPSVDCYQPTIRNRRVAKKSWLALIGALVIRFDPVPLARHQGPWWFPVQIRESTSVLYLGSLGWRWRTVVEIEPERTSSFNQPQQASTETHKDF